MNRNNKQVLNLKRFENVHEAQVYLIGNIGCLIGHMVYLVIFLLLDVKPMAVVNVFSVSFYTALAYLSTKVDKRNGLIFAALIEIMLHSCLGAYFLGWNNGFMMFMLFIMPIPFFMPLKKLYTPYVLSIIPITLFMVMRINFGRPERSVYSFHTPVINNVIYFINIIFGSVMLIYVSSIYMISRELMQQRLKTHNEELNMIATIDPLTELFNRRAMMDFLKLVQASSLKAGKSYVIGLSDIDDFKRVNDTYGHAAGDEALRMAARLMAQNVPAEGYVARWGGEEFLFAVPATDIEHARAFTEKIRLAISSEHFETEGKAFSITITIGLCEAEPGADVEKMISTADGRLYRGKSSGKNVVISE